MDHETYVWLVNPHTKGNGSTDNLQEIQYRMQYSTSQLIVYHTILQYMYITVGGSIHVPHVQYISQETVYYSIPTVHYSKLQHIPEPIDGRVFQL